MALDSFDVIRFVILSLVHIFNTYLKHVTYVEW